MAIYRVLITAKIKHGQIKRIFFFLRIEHRCQQQRQRQMSYTSRRAEAPFGSVSPVYRACHGTQVVEREKFFNGKRRR